MTHLNQEQFIDVLLREPHSVTLDQHLAECAECQEQMAVLRGGLQLTKVAEPRVPDLRLPAITYRKIKRKAVWTRLTWMAAAAMFLLSLLGFRMEVQDGSWAMQFSLLGSSSKTEPQNIAELEKRLLAAIELNSTMTQSQLDARFNAIYQEREQELGFFREAVSREMQGLEIQNAQNLVSMRNEFTGNIEKLKLEGKLK